MPGKGAQLRDALLRAITAGTLPPETRLPSTRALAGDLGVARGVVVEVYEQLVAEGWLASRPGSGTRVATPPAPAPEDTPLGGAARTSLTTTQHRAPADGPDAAGGTRAAPGRAPALDLRPARPDVSDFPRTAWVAATRAVLADLPHADLSYGDQRGHPHARDVVAAYLARVRGVRTSPELTVLTDGFSAALSAVVTSLASFEVDTVAVEDPGGYEPRGTVEGAGARTVAVPVDDEGLRVDALAATGARAVLVTPAHQYPLGSVLSPERRHALVAWARDTDSWIVEDDYDAEFRFDRAPVGAVQALAPDRTIHLGSVGKTLAPAIRVGWAVVPPALLDTVVATRHVRASQPATLDHLVVARLVEDGRYDRHLRALRRRYRARRDLLVEVLEQAGLGDRVAGVAAGLHAVLVLPGVDDVALTRALRDRDVEVVALSRYAIASDLRGLVLGYGARRPEELRRALAVVVDEVRRAERT